MGKIIVFEGIDGAGKSSAITSLHTKLKSVGKSSIILPAPTKEFTGTCCREALSKGCDSTTVFYLMMADRTIHNKQIVECKEKYDYVLVDRYFLSTLAYQYDLVEKLFYFDIVIGNAVFVDKLVYLDMDSEEAVKRITRRGEKTISFETLDSLRKIWCNYCRLLEQDESVSSWKIHNLIGQIIKIEVDCESMEEVGAEVFESVVK